MMPPVRDVSAVNINIRDSVDGVNMEGFNGERARFARGVETGRPSEIEIELHGDEVVLRGEAVVAAAGTLQLPVS